MAESHSRTRPSRRKPSRLQSRAPSSLQINRALEWNVAIPLLSPLASSPPPLPLPPQKEDPPQQQRPTEKVVFKKWQHPAAPFCYDHIEAHALYQDVLFGNQTLGPFFQHHKNTTFVNPLFKGQRVTPLAGNQVEVFDKEKGSGVYTIDLKLFMVVRFKFLLFKSASVKPKIRCALHVPLKSRNATTTISPDAAFQPTECGWDYGKKWWIH